ncbi:MAG: hypothetical protein GC151_16040 [Betaproteobacteria bacterium]|nr:hypothetical protein [Betaproteobacteria bacterium]
MNWHIHLGRLIATVATMACSGHAFADAAVTTSAYAVVDDKDPATPKLVYDQTHPVSDPDFARFTGTLTRTAYGNEATWTAGGVAHDGTMGADASGLASWSESFVYPESAGVGVLAVRGRCRRA